MSNAFVVLMGMGTVFVGLICIIVLCKLMSVVIRLFQKSPENTVEQTPVVSTNSPAVQPIPSRGELAAAITAAIAEYTGKDISGIRIHSIKKL